MAKSDTMAVLSRHKSPYLFFINESTGEPSAVSLSADISKGMLPKSLLSFAKKLKKSGCSSKFILILLLGPM